jgi:hypothetical protein
MLQLKAGFCTNCQGLKQPRYVLNACMPVRLEVASCYSVLLFKMSLLLVCGLAGVAGSIRSA